MPLVVALAGCGGARSSTATKPAAPQIPEKPVDITTFSFDQQQAPYDVFGEYRIGPGDLLDVLYQVRSWVRQHSFRLAMHHTVTVKFIYAPELNTTQQVRPDGTISLPYLGSVHAVDKSVDEFASELRQKYKPILNIPEISVEVPDFLSGIKELKADLYTTSRGLSRLVTVRPDGYVTFPMVGDVVAAGRTVPELSRELDAAYEKFLPGLNCDLFLEKPAGQVVYVVGQVARPGGFEMKRPFTVLEALALAGGYQAGAKLSSIFVVRRHQGRMVAARVDVKRTLSFGKGSQAFFLQPNDIIYVPKTWLRTAAEVAKDLMDMIFFRGWSLYGQIYVDDRGLSVFGRPE
jgi:polysaccharide export outer membrane protein